ncbi:hypothetical protein IWQ60_008349 [Tieghemiomyces parasiticus]|uniref:Uncharacterized protein n=1 Tax=Tieghemiomyces parasiticus TaxID=78921 RepID=A0A9W7ZWZ8_9FUNG|nr:hypothetical protein IWQ60_008349 [Tieghemiomyces parasiticus]
MGIPTIFLPSQIQDEQLAAERHATQRTLMTLPNQPVPSPLHASRTGHPVQTWSTPWRHLQPTDRLGVFRIFAPFLPVSPLSHPATAAWSWGARSTVAMVQQHDSTNQRSTGPTHLLHRRADAADSSGHQDGSGEDDDRSGGHSTGGPPAGDSGRGSGNRRNKKFPQSLSPISPPALLRGTLLSIRIKEYLKEHVYYFEGYSSRIVSIDPFVKRKCISMAVLWNSRKGSFFKDPESIPLWKRIICWNPLRGVMLGWVSYQGVPTQNQAYGMRDWLRTALAINDMNRAHFLKDILQTLPPVDFHFSIHVIPLGTYLDRLAIARYFVVSYLEESVPQTLKQVTESYEDGRLRGFISRYIASLRSGESINAAGTALHNIWETITEDSDGGGEKPHPPPKRNDAAKPPAPGRTWGKPREGDEQRTTSTSTTSAQEEEEDSRRDSSAKRQKGAVRPPKSSEASNPPDGDSGNGKEKGKIDVRRITSDKEFDSRHSKMSPEMAFKIENTVRKQQQQQQQRPAQDGSGGGNGNVHKDDDRSHNEKKSGDNDKRQPPSSDE